MSNKRVNTVKFTIKVGDKIPLNEQPSDFTGAHLVVTDVYTPGHSLGGFVKCGNVVFDIDGSAWGFAMRNGRRIATEFKRELVAGWDYDAEESSASNDQPDFSELRDAFMRVPEQHRAAAVEFICGLAD